MSRNNRRHSHWLAARWPVRSGLGRACRTSEAADLNPFVPDKEPMAIIVWWVKVVDVHEEKGGSCTC